MSTTTTSILAEIALYESPSRSVLTERVAKTRPLGHCVHPGRLVAADRAGHFARENTGANRVDADLHAASVVQRKG